LEMTMKHEFDILLEDVEPKLRPICKELRAIVQELHPECVELIWPKQRIASFGVGPKKMSEHYVYVAPQTKHVNLGLYHGVSMVDPVGLLEGTGKRLRHVKIRSLADAKAGPIRQLIVAAIAERQESLA